MCEFNCSHYYWSKAFPLYGHDYGSVIEAIEKMEKELPGYFYAGNLCVFTNYKICNWLIRMKIRSGKTSWLGKW